jgi:hypothetical protein
MTRQEEAMACDISLVSPAGPTPAELEAGEAETVAVPSGETISQNVDFLGRPRGEIRAN